MYHIAQRFDWESFDELNVAGKTLREKFSSEILMNRWLFIKFIKLFYCQTFALYGMYCKSIYNFWGYEISRIVQKTYGTFSGCISEWLDNMFLRFCKCLWNPQKLYPWKNHPTISELAVCLVTMFFIGSCFCRLYYQAKFWMNHICNTL